MDSAALGNSNSKNDLNSPAPDRLYWGLRQRLAAPSTIGRIFDRGIAFRPIHPNAASNPNYGLA